MRVLIITGTPCTGKTTLAKNLAQKLNFFNLDVNKLISKYRISEGYDKKRKTKIVDVSKLNKVLIYFIKQNSLNKSNKNIKKCKGIIIDSHLSHYLPRKYVDLCIVTKCDIKELNKRLGKKKYAKNKIQENLQAEIFDICHIEAIKQKHKIIVIYTTKRFINNKKFQSILNFFR